MSAPSAKDWCAVIDGLRSIERDDYGVMPEHVDRYWGYVFLLWEWDARWRADREKALRCCGACANHFWSDYDAYACRPALEDPGAAEFLDEDRPCQFTPSRWVRRD